jgi:hypothetical protein
MGKIKFRVLWAICFVCAGCINKHKPLNAKPVSTIIKPVIAKTDTIKSVIITEPALQKLVDTVNNYLAAYDTLRFYDEYDIKKFSMPKSDRDSITSVSEGKVTGGDLILYYQEKIAFRLSDILKNKQISKYKLNEIFTSLNVLDIIYSSDNRFYDLVLDEKTGGSYKSRISFIHYRAIDGNLYNYSSYQYTEKDADTSNVFATDGYSSITTLNTKQGTKYLLQGDVLGCNTCMGLYITLVSFKSNTFISDFSYSITTRMEGEINYDGKNRKITVDYTTDDQAPICNCDNLANGQGKDTSEELDESGYGKPCKCVFTFNGNTFVKVPNKIRSRLKLKG